jgi:small neutral amino acid transporter SnatA (MarC family)
VSLLLLVVAAVAVVNAPRAWSAVPGGEPALIGALGAALALAPLVVVAAFAHPIVDALELTPPTLRMAAGTVLAVQGVVTMVARSPAAEPRLAGRRAALVPMAFPVLITPGLGLLAVSGSLDRSAPTTAVVLAAALATVPALAAARGPTDPPAAPERAIRAAAALLAAAAVVAGLGLVANGLFDV